MEAASHALSENGDPGLYHLTHIPLDTMAAISQAIFSDVFFLMKSLVFLLRFHSSLFLRVQLTITKHCIRKWLFAE